MADRFFVVNDSGPRGKHLDQSDAEVARQLETARIIARLFSRSSMSRLVKFDMLSMAHSAMP